MNMEFKRKMPTPQAIKEMYPITPELAERKKITDEALRKIFTGEDDRLLLVIGPCSADREDSVLDYISRLRTVQEKVEDKILIVPRVYTNKPRTTGDGYKGMLHQPDPNSSPDMLRGLIAIRKMHMKVIAETGFSCADEMLYPENHHYLSDMLSYVAVGARSVENQLHRLTASGLDLPVGMKNPTSGDLSVMMNSITAAQHPTGRCRARVIRLHTQFCAARQINTEEPYPTITTRILRYCASFTQKADLKTRRSSSTPTTPTPASSGMSSRALQRRSCTARATRTISCTWSRDL